MSRNRLLRIVKKVFPDNPIISSIRERPDRDGIRKSLASTQVMNASLATVAPRKPARPGISFTMAAAFRSNRILKTVTLSPQDAAEVAAVLALPEDGGVAEPRNSECGDIEPSVRITGTSGPDAGRTFVADLDLTACRSLEFTKYDDTDTRLSSESVLLSVGEAAKLSKLLGNALGVDGGF